MFKNIQLYRLPMAIDAATLSASLETRAFKPCGSQDAESIGFVQPCDHSKHPMLHSIGGQILISVQIERRILPAAVVNDAVAARAADVEQQQGFKPGRKQLKELKEAVLQELLPKAFTRRKKIRAWIDPANGWLAVDAASRRAAEPVLETLYRAVDELPLLLVNTCVSPASAMTGWLAAGAAPEGFTIEQDCELRAVSNESSAVRYMQHSLGGEDIRDHIAAGKQAGKLALSFDGRLGFTLTDRLEIKRLQMLEVEPGAEQCAEDQFDADFALMTGELQRLFPALLDALGGEEQLDGAGA